jgi:hypothetical protein
VLLEMAHVPQMLCYVLCHLVICSVRLLVITLLSAVVRAGCG